MANMIKYKGQMYQRVDSEAPKTLVYKGDVFKKVDGLFDFFSRKTKKPGSLNHYRKETEKITKAEVREIKKRLEKHEYVKRVTCELQKLEPVRLGTNATYKGVITPTREAENSPNYLQRELSKCFRGSLFNLNKDLSYTLEMGFIGYYLKDEPR